MNWFSELGRRLWVLFRRSQFDRDLEEEMRLHLELRAEEQKAAGLAPDEARHAARRRFGNTTLIEEASRGMWGWTWLEDTVQDVRYAFRMLVKNPGFALVAIASLALGTGANTAIFQLLDAVRLRSLPIQNPQELAEVRIVGGHGGMGVNPGGYPELTRPIWQEIREHHEPFSGVFAWSADVVRGRDGRQPRRAKGIYVMARRRNEIGIRMALGAQRGQVVAMVMREAGRLLVIGVVAGTALSLVAGRSASSLLFGLKPYDPLTLVGAGCTVGCIRGSGHLPARAPGLQGRSHGGAALRVAGLVPISRL